MPQPTQIFEWLALLEQDTDDLHVIHQFLATVGAPDNRENVVECINFMAAVRLHQLKHRGGTK